MYKRLTPCIFIERGKAVQWFDDRTVIADDVMELARHYNERGADELIIFDLSDSDEEHDETISLLKQINRAISIPMVSSTVGTFLQVYGGNEYSVWVIIADALAKLLSVIGL